jgi:hypothetical protein
VDGKKPNHHRNKKASKEDRELLAQFLRPEMYWITYQKPNRPIGWEWPPPDDQIFECTVIRDQEILESIKDQINEIRSSAACQL